MREIKKTGEPKDDFFVKLTALQITFAVLIGGIFFGAYKLNTAFYGELREGFSLLMAKDSDVEELIPYNFMKEETTSERPTEEQTEKNEKLEKTEKKEDSGQSGKSDQETTEKAEGTAGQTGAGGEDTAVSEAVSAVNVSVLNGLEAVMPVNGVYTSFFGKRVHPVYGTEGFHSGLDIAAREGTPVLAALDGVVEMTGVGEMSGNYVKLNNGNGVETLYCHCSEISAENGQRVRRGDVIAYVGQTGLATGPHLHFELQIDGVKCDPKLLLQNAVSAS